MTNGTWTQEQVTQLQKHMAAGLPSAAIASMLGRTLQSVKSKRKNLAPRKSKRGKGKRWTAGEEQVLLGACKDGESLTDIADTLGRTLGSVTQKYRELTTERPTLNSAIDSPHTYTAVDDSPPPGFNHIKRLQAVSAYLAELAAVLERGVGLRAIEITADGRVKVAG